MNRGDSLSQKVQKGFARVRVVTNPGRSSCPVRVSGRFKEPVSEAGGGCFKVSVIILNLRKNKVI